MPKISLYIPCFNVEKYIARCIEGILNQTYPVDEILVIDDGSRDRTVEIASQYPVRIVKHEVNKGLSAARNTGFQNASNEWVASLDADCVADSHWLEKLVASLEEDEKIAVAGGRLVEIVQDSWADRWRKVHMTQDWGDNRLSDPPFMYGNNSLIRKSVIEEVGCFNEKLRTNGEDVDMSNRIYEKGYHIVYEPAAIVNHLRHDNIPSILDTFWRYLRFSYPTYKEITFKCFLHNAYNVHLKGVMIDLLYRDLKRNKNYHFIPLDLFVPWYLTYRNLKLLLENKKEGKETTKG